MQTNTPCALKYHMYVATEYHIRKGAELLS